MVLTGRFALIALAAAVFVAVVVPSWLGVLLASGLLVVLALADFTMTPRADRISLRRPELTTVRLGTAANVELVVGNEDTRRIRGMLWQDWPGSAQAQRRRVALSVPPGKLVRYGNVLTPLHRGDRVAGPVTVRLIGPLGLAGAQTRHDVPARIRALPAFRSEKLLNSRVRLLRHLEGRNVALIRGQGTEFDSVREYVAGDDVRSIDWRATARADDVMVRTWRPERNRNVLLLLDTGRVSAGRVGDTTRLDAAMEAALLLGGLAAAAGDTVGMLAYDRQVRAEVRGVSGKQLQLRLMHAMAGLQATLVDTDCAALVRAAVHRCRGRSLVVWFTNVESGQLHEYLLPVLPALVRRHHVLIVSVTDPDLAAAARRRDTLDDIYLAAAAEGTLADRELVRQTLRGKGVAVVAAPPERLAAELADAYLELKRAGTM